MTFNLVDVIAVLVIAVAVVFGWRSGFVVQAFALGGFLAGLALVVLAAPFIGPVRALLSPEEIADAESRARLTLPSALQ